MSDRRLDDWIERLNPDLLTKVLIALLVAVTLMAFGVIGLYSYRFHGSLAADQAVWGQFGDYVGGTLNPLVSSITLLGLLLTVLLQRKELQEASRDARDR